MLKVDTLLPQDILIAYEMKIITVQETREALGFSNVKKEDE